MSDLIAWALAVAAIGPAAAALVWLGLSRWPRVAWAALGVSLVVSHAAAWAVFWFVYRGDEVVWRGLGPSLLGATLAAAAEIGVLLVLFRAPALAPRRLPTLVVGLCVGTSAIVYGSYVDSLLVMALFFPVTTLATAMAVLGDPERADPRGLLSLALADAAAVGGLTALEARLGTTMLGPDPGATLAYGLAIGGAAVKAGAIPGLGAWRLTAAGGVPSLMASAVRGQAMVLAGVVSLQVTMGREADPGALGAAGALLLVAAVGLAARRPDTALATALGAGLGVALLALGLGGGVGARAFLVLAPAYLLAAGGAVLLGWEPPEDDRSSRERDRRPPPSVWRWVGAASVVVVLASLIGIPPGAGFPGTWLALGLAGVRGLAEPFLLVAAAGAAVALAGSFLASVPLVAAVRTRAIPAILGAAVALALLYAGLQPVRLGIGWWLRVEAELRLPEVLPAAGAPDLPPLGGGRALAGVILPAVVVVGLVLVLGRGLRDVRAEFVPPLGGGAEAAGKAWARVQPLLTRVRGIGRRASAQGLGFGMALVFEVVAVVMAARLLLIGARSGFL